MSASELLDKLTSYNIFNYLLPGIVFSILAEHVTNFDLVYDDVFIAPFLFYFVGLIISRIGSIVIAPFLKLIGVIKFANYSDYLEALEKDSEIRVLSEANNSFRTYCSVFVCLFALKIYEIVFNEISFVAENSSWLLILSLFVLFLFAYKKQTEFIVKRVTSCISKK